MEEAAVASAEEHRIELAGRTAGAEKTLQQVARLAFLDACDHFDDVVQSPGRSNWKDRTCATRAVIADAEHKAFQAREHQGAGAHGTGFFRDEERATFQPPVPEGMGGLCDRKNL